MSYTNKIICLIKQFRLDAAVFEVMVDELCEGMLSHRNGRPPIQVVDMARLRSLAGGDMTRKPSGHACTPPSTSFHPNLVS